MLGCVDKVTTVTPFFCCLASVVADSDSSTSSVPHSPGITNEGEGDGAIFPVPYPNYLCDFLRLNFAQILILKNFNPGT